MKKIFTWFIYLLLFSRGFAWYPEYSVMVTDFLLPHDYLAPTQVQPVGLLALGSQFRYIYQDPVENVFQNPAYLSHVRGKYLYFDLAGSDVTRKMNDPVYPIYYGNVDIMYSPPPYYWSPYRYIDEPGAREPLIRLIYLGKPYGNNSPLGLGATVEYFYDQEKFYQPFWYNYGWRNKDALGEVFSAEVIDPYEDYRQVEYGKNLLKNDGINISAFLSFELSNSLDLGVRYSLLNMDSDGRFADMNLYNDSQYYREYLNYSDVQASRQQNYRKNEYSAGVIWKMDSKSVIGLSLGYSKGIIERRFFESDSTFYHSYRFYGPDTTDYRITDRNGRSTSDKNWGYDGHAVHINMHGDFQLNPDVLLRLAVYREKRKAQLTESEITLKDNYYYTRYWWDYGGVMRDYLNISGMTLNRTGQGDFRQKRTRISIGADWQLSSKIRFLGGLVFDSKKWNLEADEPFTGSKYSLHEYENFSHPYWNIRETSREDDKKFHWYRRESYTFLTVPTGIIVQPVNALEFQLGMTKIIKKTDIREGYDLVVYHESIDQYIDGVQTSISDSSYVEGHVFPGTNEFINKYQMNAGISFKYKNVFKVSIALSESILKPEYYKIGVEFWL